MMGSMGGTEKDINIMTGGHGDLMPYVMSMMQGQNKDGFGGGMGMLLLLALLLFRGGEGGLLGRGCAAGAAVGAAGAIGCQDWLSLFSQLSSIKETTQAGNYATAAAIDAAADRVNVAASVANANINSNIGETKSLLTALNGNVSNGFFQVARDTDRASNATNALISQQFSGLDKELCQAFASQTAALNCSTNSLMSGISGGFNALTSQNASMLNTLSTQNMTLANQIDKVACQSNTNTEKILCAIKTAEDAGIIRSLQSELERSRCAHGQVLQNLQSLQIAMGNSGYTNQRASSNAVVA